jgi:hypothetical protein
LPVWELHFEHVCASLFTLPQIQARVLTVAAISRHNIGPQSLRATVASMHGVITYRSPMNWSPSPDERHVHVRSDWQHLTITDDGSMDLIEWNTPLPYFDSAEPADGGSGPPSFTNNKRVAASLSGGSAYYQLLLIRGMDILIVLEYCAVFLGVMAMPRAFYAGLA